MPKKPKKRREELTFEPFFGRWAGSVREAQRRDAQSKGLNALRAGQEDPAPRTIVVHKFSSQMWSEVAGWWPFQLLREAAEEGDAEGYKRLLSYFLGRLDARPPEGVIAPFRWPPGRRDETESIYRSWMSIGAPKLTWREKDALAKAHYPQEFIESLSDVMLRKKLRDRVGAAVKRHGANDRQLRD